MLFVFLLSFFIHISLYNNTVIFKGRYSALVPIENIPVFSQNKAEIFPKKIFTKYVIKFNFFIASFSVNLKRDMLISHVGFSFIIS